MRPSPTLRVAAAVLFGALVVALSRAGPDGLRGEPSPGGTAAAAGPVEYWLAPLPARGPEVGAQDYLSLFSRKARWSTAAARLHHFKFYQDWVLHAPEADLTKAVTDLTRRGLALWIETAAHSTSLGCGYGVEGFVPEPALSTIDAVRRIEGAGGTVTGLAMSEPVSFGTAVYGGPNACNWTVQQVAERVGAYLDDISQFRPSLQFGDIESDHTPVAMVAEFMDAMATLGYPLGFLHWDVDWQTAPDWVERAAEMAELTRYRGVRFGMLYYGSPAAATDASWVDSARQHTALFESITGIQPDDVVIQSFHPRPNLVLPEKSSGTLTFLVNSYFASRTTLTLSASPSVDGGVAVSGRPRRGSSSQSRKTVVAVARPLDGPGIVYDYVLSSVVPSNATTGIVGFRVNTECSCAGGAEFELLEVRYSEASAVEIPNGSFDSALDDWAVWGTATGSVSPASDGSGAALRVTATAEQFILGNSAEFEVTPGSTFTMVFRAKVAPASEGSGYFGIFFPTATGDHRKTIQLSGPETVVTTRTNSRGAYSLIFPPTPGTTAYRLTIG